MKTQTTLLSITPFTNRNGVTSYRVGGYVRGERIRKNFKTRDDAIAEKNTLEIKFAQTDAGLRTVGTFLTEAQLREAEALYLRFKDNRARCRSTPSTDSATTKIPPARNLSPKPSTNISHNAPPST
jgi:hypothetical protein